MTLRAWFASDRGKERRSQAGRSRRRRARPAVDGLEARCLMADIGQDIALIDANANPSLNLEELPWVRLVTDGGMMNPPWNQLYPYDFSPHDDSSTTTTTTDSNGATSTITSGGSSGGIVTGNPNGGSNSGGGPSGPWDETYSADSQLTSEITGPDGNGGSVDNKTTSVYHLTWHAWGDGSGSTNFKVTQDITDSTTESTTGGNNAPASVKQGNSRDSHLVVNGQSSWGGNSGTFTYSGDLAAYFVLHDESGTDGGGNAQGAAPGFTADYSTSTKDSYSGSGNLNPDSSNQDTDTITSSENGTLGSWDGNGGLVGGSRDDSDEVKDSYSGSSQPTTSGISDASTSGASLSGTPLAPTTGTVATNGPSNSLTGLTIPPGKNTVYVIDQQDQGWANWDGNQRAQYIQDHDLRGVAPDDPSPVATGTQFLAGLAPPSGYISATFGLQQVVNDLTEVVAVDGLIDVLVIGDHGNAQNGQQIGGRNQPYLTAPTDPATLRNNTAPINQVVGFVRSGGTLVLTGCSVFGSQLAVDAWQAYATAKNITIEGSASLVYWGGPGTGNVQGAWIVLAPGGTAPTIVTNPPSSP